MRQQFSMGKRLAFAWLAGAILAAAPAYAQDPIKLADNAPLMRDGDVDADVVWHEYGHGLTWRMIGKMSGPLAGAIGEGNSDVLAVIANEDDRVGEYSSSDPLGIRTEPYSNYSRTYGDIVGQEVHLDGEVYGAVGWYGGGPNSGVSVLSDTPRRSCAAQHHDHHRSCAASSALHSGARQSFTCGPSAWPMRAWIWMQRAATAWIAGS